MENEEFKTFYGHLQENAPEFQGVGIEQFKQAVSDPQAFSTFYKNFQDSFPEFKEINEEQFRQSIGFPKEEPNAQDGQSEEKPGFWSRMAKAWNPKTSTYDSEPGVAYDPDREGNTIMQANADEVKRPDDYAESQGESSWLSKPFYSLSDEDLQKQIAQLEEIDNKAMKPIYDAFEKRTGHKYNPKGGNSDVDETIFRNITESMKSAELMKRGYYNAGAMRRAKIKEEVDELFEDNSADTKQARERLARLRQERAWRSRQEDGSYTELGRALEQQKNTVLELAKAGPEDFSLTGAKKYLDDAIKLYNAPSAYGESNGFVNWAKGLGDQIINYDTWTAGATEMARMIDLNRIVNKLDKGEKLTDSEEAKLNSFLLYNATQEARQEDISKGYNIGKGSAESIPFMAEMLITAGIGAAAKKAIIKGAINTGNKTFARRMARAFGEEITEETIERNAKKEVVNFATKEAKQGILEKGARQVAGDVAMTATMPTTWTAITEEAVDKKLRGEEFAFSDALRTFANQTVETGTERWGGKLVDNALGKAMPLDKIWGKTRWGKLLTNDFIQSPIGETGEEYVGAAVNYLRSFNPLYSDESNEQLRHDARQMFSIDGLTQTFLTVLPMSALGGVANVVEHKKTINEYKAAKGDLLTILQNAGSTKDEAEDIVSKIESADDSRGFTARLEYSMSALRMIYQEQHPDATLEEQKAYFKKLDEAFGRYFQSAFYLNELGGEIKEKIDNLDDNMKQEVIQAVNNEINEQTKRIGNQPTPVRGSKRIEVKDANNKKVSKPVNYSADNLVLKDDGTIDETQSENLVLKDFRGNEIKGKQREEWLEALNAVLANEHDIEARRIALQKQEEERKQSEDRKEKERLAKLNAETEKKIADMQESIKGVTKKNGDINMNEATPAQVVFFLHEKTGDINQTLDIVAARIIELNNEMGKKGNAVEKWQLGNKINEYYAAVGEWIGEPEKAQVQAAVNQALNVEQKPVVEEAPKIEQLQEPVKQEAPAVEEAPVVEETQEPVAEETQEPVVEKTPVVEETPQEEPQETPAEEAKEEPIAEEPAAPVKEEPMAKAQKNPKEKAAWPNPFDKDNNALVQTTNKSMVIKNRSDIKDGEVEFNPITVYRKEGSKYVPYIIRSSRSNFGLNSTVQVVGSDGVEKKVYVNQLFADNKGEKPFVISTGAKLKVENFGQIANYPVYTSADGTQFTLQDLLTEHRVRKNVDDEKKTVKTDAITGYEYVKQQVEAENPDDPRAIETLNERVKHVITMWNTLAKTWNDMSLDRLVGRGLNYDMLLAYRAAYYFDAVSTQFKEADRLKKQSEQKKKDNGVEETILGKKPLTVEDCYALAHKIDANISEGYNFTVSGDKLDAKNFSTDGIKSNPLYRMACMIEIAKNMPEMKDVNFEMELPASLKKILSAKIITAKQIEEARVRYKEMEKQEKKNGTTDSQAHRNRSAAMVEMEDNIPEVLNTWAPLTRAYGKEGYDKVKPLLKQEAGEAKKGRAYAKETTALKNFEDLCENALAALRSGNNSLFEKLNKQIGKIVTEHALEKTNKYATRLARFQNTIKTIMSTAYPEVAKFAQLKKKVDGLTKMLADGFEPEATKDKLDVAEYAMEEYSTKHPNAEQQYQEMSKRDFPEGGLRIEFQEGENVPMSEFTETEKKSKQARIAYNALVAALQRVKGLNLHMVGNQAEARRVLEMIQGNPELMSVFHGSGAVFDKFDLSHVGEGEGSQAYGFGVYVSNQHGTANYYAKIASKNTRGYVYSVEIPDDNGKNYLDWNKPMTREEAYEFVEQFKKYYPFINKVTGFSKGDFEEIKEKIDYNIDTYGDIRFGVLYSNLGWLISPKINNRTLNFDKLASEALRKLGYIGIKVPVYNRSGGSYNVDGTNYIIFDERDLKITGRDTVEFFKAQDGTIYGWSIGNDMYLTDEGLNPETPIHEYTHIWLNALKVGNKAAYDKVLRAIKARKGLWEKVTKDPAYAHLTTDEEIASEVLARYSGKRGAARLMELANELYGQKPDAEPTTLTKTFISKMQSILQEFWDAVKGLFGIQSMDDISDWVLKDLFDGKPLDFNTEEMQAIKEKAKADGTFMKTPDGRPTKLTERQWLQVRTKAFKEWYGDWENPKEGEFFLLDGNQYVWDEKAQKYTFVLKGEPKLTYHGTEYAGYDLMDPKDYDDLDENGNPKSSGRGIFMTPQQFVAGVYAGLTGEDVTENEALIGDDPHRGIYSLYSNMHNPLIVNCADEEGNASMWHSIPTGIWKIVGGNMPTQYFNSYDEAVGAYYEQGWGVSPEGTDLEEPELVPETHTTDEFVELARAQGYDGVIFMNIIDGTDSKLLDDDVEDRDYMRAHDVYVAMAPNQVKSATQNSGLFSMQDARIEYQYSSAMLNEHDDKATKANEKSKMNSAFHEAIANPAEGLQVSKFISEYMDMMEGMRVLQDNLAAYLRMTGEADKLPDKYDIRNMFESKDSIAMNAIRKFNKTLAAELNEAVIQVQEAIGKTAFYEAHKKEVGGEHPADLTPIEFVGRYLIARNDYERAKEGTARGMETFYERMGMTTEEFWRQFHENVDESLLLNLWDKIKQVTDFELDVALEGQLITGEEYDRLKAKKFYVPQRGFWDDVNPENKEEKLEVRHEKGMSKIQLSSMNKARGGKSLAENPLVYIYRDANEAIVKSENNKVKIALFNMLTEQRTWCEMPEVGFDAPVSITYRAVEGDFEKLVDGYTEEDRKKMREIKKRIDDLKRRIDNTTGEPETEVLDALIDLNDQLAAIESNKIDSEFMNDDIRKIYNHKNRDEKRNTIGVLINGVQHEIVMPEKFALTAQAFNGRRNTEGVLGDIRTATSFLAAQFTVNNPTFWTVNFTRDVLFIELKGGTEYGPEFNLWFSHYLYYGQGALNRYLKKGYVEGSADGQMDAWMREFLDNGGNTGLFNDLDLEKFRYDVRHLDPKAKTKWEKAYGGLYNAYQIATLQPVANYMNELSELTSRFAIFCAAKRMGLDTNEATKASHNLSVNFNRRGLGNQFLNIFSTITPFVNATIQGTTGFWRTFGAGYGATHEEKIKKALKAGCVMAALPAFLGCLNAVLCPDDPDDVDGKISEWDRMNYVCFPNGVRIPLPQEIRPFWAIGVNIGLLIRGQRTTGEFANSLFKSVLMNGLPLPQNISEAGTMVIGNYTGDEYRNVGDITRTLVQPSFFGTLGQIAENRNFLGGKLRYDIKDFPEYEMAPNESSFYRSLSYAAYVVGFGDTNTPSKHRNAKIDSWWSEMSNRTDVNPKQWKSYLFLIPSGVLDMYATAFGGIYAGIDAARGEYDEKKNYLRAKDAFIANKFYRPANKDGNRYAVKKEAKAFIDKFDNVQSNALNSAYRFAATGEDERSKASVDRYATVTEDYLEVVTRLKKDYELLQKISRQAVKNQLHLSDNTELNDVVGIEAYNSLDDAEKEVVIRLNHDLRVLRDMDENPTKLDNINVIDTIGVIWRQGRGQTTDGKSLIRDMEGNVYIEEKDGLRKVSIKK